MSNRTWTNYILDIFSSVGVKSDQELILVSGFVALTAIGISTCFLLLASGDLEMSKVKGVFSSLAGCCSGKRNKAKTGDKFGSGKTKTADLCEDSDGIELAGIVLEPSLEGVMVDDTPILTRGIAAVISDQLPSVQKLSDWKFSFAPRQHGVSYKTFYKQLKDNGPSVMLIKTTDDDLFGAFCSHDWHMSSGAFYGNGECFVFSFGKVKNIAAELDTKEKITKKFEYWRSTDKTSAYMFSDNETIAIGGGGKTGGSAAILIDGSFNKVSSAPTVTFGNKKPIVDSGNTNYFTIRDMEVWTFAI